MVKSTTSGNDMMLFVKDASGNFKSLGVATSHTLTITGNDQTINSKDHGVFEKSTVNTISWEATTENLHTSDYDVLFDYMMERNPITIAFGTKSQTTTLDVSTSLNAYTPGTTYKTGTALITNLTLNAPSGDNATYSATFKGSGALTKVTA